MNKIFVLTGFDFSEKEEFEKEIVKRGGIVKSSTVLKTDYLIFDERFGRDTTKYNRALGLNANGYDIQIIPGKQFKKWISK